MIAHWQTLCETRWEDKITLVVGIQLLIQAERNKRLSNRVNRHLKSAGVPYLTLVEEIYNNSIHGIAATMIADVATCDFVKCERSVIISGATGNDKSNIATAS